MEPAIRIAILASGTGSNAMALLQAGTALAPAVCIPLVVCDQRGAPVLDKVAPLGAEPVLIERTADREAHEAAILARLHQARIDWIFLAGYMRLLSPAFIGAWRAAHGGAAQIVNIHPSRLPAYRGLQAVERAVANDDREVGVTLHYVDEGMDTGSIVAQELVARAQAEPVEQLLPRLHAVEHRLYTDFLRRVASGEIVTRQHQEQATC